MEGLSSELNDVVGRYAVQTSIALEEVAGGILCDRINATAAIECAAVVAQCGADRGS